MKPIRTMYATKAEFDAAYKLWKDDSPEDTYDSRGNLTPGGMFDAGGHLIDGERLADLADFLDDEFKYR